LSILVIEDEQKVRTALRDFLEFHAALKGEAKKQYGIRSSRTGRIIATRLFEGEDIYQCIEQLANKDIIKSAAVLITGGFRKANIVVGPKQEKPKIVGNFKDFAGPGKALGVGTIYCDHDGPKLHIHTAISKGGETIVGCPRGGVKTPLCVEITIIESKGIQSCRKADENTGLNLLQF